MTLPEGRKPLTDEDMVILLHNMARAFTGSQHDDMRQTADRFSELAKSHKAKQE